MDGLRKIIEVEKKKRFTADFPEAVIREGAEELNSRAGEVLTTHLHRHNPCGGRAMGT